MRKRETNGAGGRKPLADPKGAERRIRAWLLRTCPEEKPLIGDFRKDVTFAEVNLAQPRLTRRGDPRRAARIALDFKRRLWHHVKSSSRKENDNERPDQKHGRVQGPPLRGA